MGKHVDKHSSMRALLGAEDPINYSIQLVSRDSPVAIIAPHGGKIEQGTSEIANGIAGTTYNLYCFEGQKSQRNYADLHVTSTKFDEPKCLKLIQNCDFVIAIHGCKDLRGQENAVYLGGLDTKLQAAILEQLRKRDFVIGDRDDLQGSYARNVCNRGRLGKGVQLEISATLRHEFIRADSLAPSSSFLAFVEAVTRAIEEQRL